MSKLEEASGIIDKLDKSKRTRLWTTLLSGGGVGYLAFVGVIGGPIAAGIIGGLALTYIVCETIRPSGGKNENKTRSK